MWRADQLLPFGLLVAIYLHPSGRSIEGIKPSGPNADSLTMATSTSSNLVDHYAVFAYAFMAMIYADGLTPDDEVAKAQDLLVEWRNGFGGSEADCQEGWERANAWRRSGASPTALLPNVGRFISDQPRQARQEFLADLLKIAIADGALRESEMAMLETIASYCGFRSEASLTNIRQTGSISFADHEGSFGFTIPIS
jgi:uncharacterized tellurite resistance protein B-like protein